MVGLIPEFVHQAASLRVRWTSRWCPRLAVRILRQSDLDRPVPDEMIEFLSSKPEGPNKFATILADKTRQLLGLDRYERRALSRRKFAIRAFDAARR